MSWILPESSYNVARIFVLLHGWVPGFWKHLFLCYHKEIGPLLQACCLEEGYTVDSTLREKSKMYWN